jgi:hypothetical protein
MGALVNRCRFLGGNVILVAVLSIAVFKGAGAGPSRALVPRQDECAKLLEKIKEIERELDTIRERKPPFDKMDQAEINTNTTYRENQIKIQKSRRYALGCPGAEPVTFGSSPGVGGSGTGGGSVTGNIPGTLEGGGLSLKEYADSVPGAIYIAGDPHTCNLPGNGPLLTVGSSSKARFNPGNLVDREFTSEVQINGMKARA